jgi:hypothetical protein
MDRRTIVTKTVLVTADAVDTRMTMSRQNLAVIASTTRMTTRTILGVMVVEVENPAITMTIGQPAVEVDVNGAGRAALPDDGALREGPAQIRTSETRTKTRRGLRK